MVGAVASGDDPRVPVTGRERLIEFLELLAAAGIAVAEPIVTAFGDGADIFVLRQADSLDIVVFTLIVVFGPPAGLWLLLQVLGRMMPSRRAVLHHSLIGLLGTIVVVRALNQVSVSPRALVIGVALVAGVALALALARWQAAHRWLQVLAVFPVLLGVSFLLTDPVATLVFGGDGSSVAPARINSPHPVVMLVLDELPTASLLDDDDRISAEQFPNLAALAGQATWYRNHSSVAPSTPQAVPAILTGSLPTDVDAPPVAEEYPDNLFTALRGSYGMHVREGATQLCPTDVCAVDRPTKHPVTSLLTDAAALWSDQLAADEQDRQGDFAVRQSDPNAPVTFESFLAGVEATDAPRLDFHHALYPHQPWFHLPSGRTYDAPFVAEGLTGPQYSWTGGVAAASGRQRHLLQARHADALVGQLIDRLKELDRYDESLIVVTADHGVAFDAGEPVRGLSADNAEQVMWTPLLIKEPGQTEGRVDEQPVQAIDLLPTIADHLDLDLAFDTDGSSVVRTSDAPPTGEDDRVFFDWSLNQLPADDDGLARVDGRAGYAAMLDLAAPGLGDDPDLRFYRFGLHGDLVGTAPDDHNLGAPIAGDARLDQHAPSPYITSDVPPVPAYVSGSVPADGPVDVAVAVNGTIGGWGRTEPKDGEQHFWTMVPPQLVIDGIGKTEVYVIEDRADSVVLRPVTVADGGR